VKTPSQNPSCIIDTDRHEITINGNQVYVPSKEYKVALAFANSKGSLLTRENILQIVWGYHPAEIKIDTRTVDQHIARLRVKMRKYGAANLISTVPGAGYRANGISLKVEKMEKALVGRVSNIRRVYGKKPGSHLTMFVPDLLPEMEKGRSLRLS
jgi:DNA-binding winged helix-turn-helix (wHTH) protein